MDRFDFKTLTPYLHFFFNLTSFLWRQYSVQKVLRTLFKVRFCVKLNLFKLGAFFLFLALVIALEALLDLECHINTITYHYTLLSEFARWHWDAFSFSSWVIKGVSTFQAKSPLGLQLQFLFIFVTCMSPSFTWSVRWTPLGFVLEQCSFFRSFSKSWIANIFDAVPFSLSESYSFISIMCLCN